MLFEFNVQFTLYLRIKYYNNVLYSLTILRNICLTLIYTFIFYYTITISGLIFSYNLSNIIE